MTMTLCCRQKTFSPPYPTTFSEIPLAIGCFSRSLPIWKKIAIISSIQTLYIVDLILKTTVGRPICA